MGTACALHGAPFMAQSPNTRKSAKAIDPATPGAQGLGSKSQSRPNTGRAGVAMLHGPRPVAPETRGCRVRAEAAGIATCRGQNRARPIRDTGSARGNLTDGRSRTGRAGTGNEQAVVAARRRVRGGRLLCWKRARERYFRLPSRQQLPTPQPQAPSKCRDGAGRRRDRCRCL